MSRAAIKKAHDYTLDAYSRRVLNALVHEPARS
jgi:hypothetical protein